MDGGLDLCGPVLPKSALGKDGFPSAMNEIVNLLPLIAAPIAALIANGYVAAIIIAALFYIVGKVGLDIAVLNPGGLSQGETFSVTWWSSLFAQLLLVSILAALFVWLFGKAKVKKA